MAGRDASTGAEPDDGFDFAFDSEPFSDRVLRIEIVGSGSGISSSSEYGARGSGADVTSRKRRREQDRGDDTEGSGSSFFDRATGSSLTVTSTPFLRVKKIHINSAILARKSPFFFKLFSNGMKESGQRQATVRIADSEENAFMELLRFMYSGKLTSTIAPTLLVGILMAADKFEVSSCMRLCNQLLMPMTPESAVMCLDLPSSISVAADLTEAAKKFLSKRYKDFLSPKFQDELMTIPLAGIVAILSRYDLLSVSEVAVYDFVLRWALTQYSSSEERCKILSSRLLPLVRRMQGVDNATIIDKLDCEIKFILKRERCSWLPARPVYCREFRFAGNVFSLSFHCNTEPSSCFGLVLEMLEDKGPMRGTIDYKFETKTRPSLKFVTRYECTSTDSREAVECKDLFGVPWSKFIADGSPFFIDDVLHLRVHLKMTQKP
ncbi:unnamed protein product [Alopecurus aequalis]